MFIENFTYVANLIGVIAFAASGVIKGLKHKLDILGVVVLAVMTAVGVETMAKVFFRMRKHSIAKSRIKRFIVDNISTRL